MHRGDEGLVIMHRGDEGLVIMHRGDEGLVIMHRGDEGLVTSLHTYGRDTSVVVAHHFISHPYQSSQ